MAQSFCPYLGTLDAQDNQGTPVDYPSFENHCLVAERQSALLLGDQATFCLVSGHRYCPRYQTAVLTVDFDPNALPPSKEADGEAPFASDLLATDWAAADLESGDDEDDARSRRRLWGWVGAGIMFLMVLLCGAVFAAYTGWQMVNHSLLGQTTARVSTLSAQTTPAPAPVYVVMTATSPPQAGAPTPPAPQGNNLLVTTTLPVAVTPTAVVVSGEQIAGAPSNSQSTDNTLSPTVDPQLNPLPTLPPADQATAPVDLQVEVPTRRATPAFDIPTSTPAEGDATATPVFTPTPTPPRGTPVVEFGPLEQQIMIHTCTGIRWHVENVQSVYYENQPVQGDGTQEECIKENPKTYKLAVVLYDGTTQIFSTTVMPLFPTRTPTATPSFTPEVIPTPTWTAEPPTPTPTPSVHYATSVAIDGGNQHSCSIGTTCEIGVLVTNSGDTSDNISLALVQSGPWSPKVCRLDGVCSDNSLPLNGMGPGNTAYAKLVVTIPADATGQTASYGIRSISNGSNGMVMSDIVTVAVEAK